MGYTILNRNKEQDAAAAAPYCIMLLGRYVDKRRIWYLEKGMIVWRGLQLERF